MTKTQQAANDGGIVGANPARRGGKRRNRHERESLALVLDLVRSGAASTRQEIERSSGLGRAAVADRVASLAAHGLLDEGELAASTGGRAPRQVRFAAGAGRLLVASLGTTTLGAGLADLSGRLLVEHHEPGGITLGAEATLDRLDALFEWMLQEHAPGREVWGMGLGLPGAVELARGRLSTRPVLHLMPGWDEYPVVERLERRYGVPVWIDSEVHLMALGELRAGRGMGRDDLVFMKIGTSVSAGLCSGGRIHRGARGYAGDIGHVAVSEDEAVICRCGNTGCLEALAGGAAIAREGQLAGQDRRSPYLAETVAQGRAVTGADVGLAASLGDPFSVELLSRCGRLVGTTLATLVNAYNPSLVVVGGGVAQAGEILLAAVREAVYRHSRSPATQELQIVRSEMGKTAGLVGAAFAVSDELFAPGFFSSWIDLGSPRRREPDEPSQTQPPLVSRRPPVTPARKRPTSTAGTVR